ncbi:L-aspartate oxidase [Arthrobacter roseus]|uniref:L-aspartate oxidase n=1 Tax=Arthrobacter roseus TaxID=136274 RepID=UPI0019628C90|nr:L-aspartate oxidase [Arthrobacter roseus]MBM7848957.1 L-aspartate oxidase [Arthrobacter roseus]
MNPAGHPEDLLIAGTGIAGLHAALCAVRMLPSTAITLVTKSSLQQSNTWHAQGGIAAVLPQGQCATGDSWQAHSDDTVRAGASTANTEAVDALCSDAAARIQSLLTEGVRLDREADGRLCLTREAAHSAPRILHCGGDATGKGIASALIDAVLAEPRITVLDDAFLIDVVVRQGKVTGATVLMGGSEQHLAADAVVLATGGAGQLYEHNTNPDVATADGVAIAWRAGAALTDLEFFQFHPTSLDVPGNPLISEALRGEGAVLLDAAGERFMTGYHPDAELAPRDVVSRSIMRHLQRTGERNVFLDARALDRGRPEYLAERFPTLARLTSDHGFDWTSEPIPVVPAAHYWMGGVRTDLFGRTSLEGLYAVGETACTGVHGANRLASNSLLEGLVFAERAITAMAAGTSGGLGSAAGAPMTGVWPLADVGLRELPTAATEPFTRAELQRLMWEKAGVIRDSAGLRTASKQLATWSSLHHGTRHVTDYEDENLLITARLLVAAAANRRESLGAHYRTDFPLAPTTDTTETETSRLYARTSA